MALGTGATIGLAALPYALRAISWGVNKTKRGLYPEYYRRQNIFKRINATPEQYELRKQNLQEGLASIARPQRVFGPERMQVEPGEDLTGNFPQQVGRRAQPARPGSLSAILQTMDQSARSGYQNDVAEIGTRLGPVRNPIGRSSGQLGMMADALKERASGLAQNKFNLLANYANRNAMSEIESGGLNLQRDEAQNQLQNFLNQARTQQISGRQSQYLGQQQLGIDRSRLRNILEGELAQQGLRQYRIGQQNRYNVQRIPGGV